MVKLAKALRLDRRDFVGSSPTLPTKIVAGVRHVNPLAIGSDSVPSNNTDVAQHQLRCWEYE